VVTAVQALEVEVEVISSKMIAAVMPGFRAKADRAALAETSRLPRRAFPYRERCSLAAEAVASAEYLSGVHVPAGALVRVGLVGQGDAAETLH
jgi:hypothetical protein